jgi:hexokinase
MPLTSFPISCIRGEDNIKEEELLESFSNYVNSDEREVLQKSLSDDLDCQDEDLLDFLSTYKCFRLPTRDTMRTILLELAHQEIIQRPRYIANCLARAIFRNEAHC